MFQAIAVGVVAGGELPAGEQPAGEQPDFNRYVHYMKVQFKELTENYDPVLA